MKNINELENTLGYKFNNKCYLEMALTHSSFIREKNTKHQDNERLEFLGDAFLDLVISEILYQRMERKTEGTLTKTRAIIVCEKSLAKIAHELDIGQDIRMGHGEEITGGRNKDSILADTVEAIIGAIFLDGGFQAAGNFIKCVFKNIIEEAVEGKIFLDYKSEIQEILQEKGKNITISYITDKEEGPAHDKTFYVHMECNGNSYGSGTGKSKKDAEQNAARASLAMLERR